VLLDAYAAVAREEKDNPGFRVGTPADLYYPAFSGDGRVAYRNEWHRICFIEGARRDAASMGYADKDLEHGFSGLPFYVAGVLTIRHGSKDLFYQLRDGAWQLAVGPIASPYPLNQLSPGIRNCRRAFPDRALPPGTAD